MTSIDGGSASEDIGLADAWTCFDQGRLEDAIRITRHALETTFENRADCNAALGWFLLSAGSVAEAKAILVSSIGRYPEHAPLHWYLGLVYAQEKRLEEASQALMAAITLDPKLDEAAETLAWVLGDLRRFDQATQYARLALALKVRPGRLALLGWLLLSQEAWDEATLPLTQALQLEPDRQETRCHLSTALLQLGRNDEARAVLEEGLLISPEAAILQHESIRLLLKLNLTQEARLASGKLLQQRTKDGIGWYLFSQVLLQRGRRGMALRALARARRLAPTLPEPWQQTGWLALEAGDLRTAQQAVERVLALVPEDASSDILASSVQESCGNWQAASDHAERAVSRAAQSAAAWRALAQVRARQHRLDEATEALHTALALDPQNIASTYHQLGWVCVADRRFKDAIAAFTAAVENNAADASSWYGLAEANRAEGKLVDALIAIGNTLQLRDQGGDRALRGQIIHEQVHYYLKRNLHSLNAAPRPLPPSNQRPCTPSAQYEYVLCSLSTKSHLHLMTTLATSARKYFNGKIYLLVVDSDDLTQVPAGTTLIHRDDIVAPAVWQDMSKRYNILELCCALKSYLMRFLAATVGCPIVYLDADTYLLGPLDTLLPEDPNFSVFLTPHLFRPMSGERRADEIVMLAVGAYNGGMLATGRHPDGIRFLDWWLDRVTQYAYDSREQGVFTDQKWLDLVPSFFRNVQISEAVGLNVGPWRVCSEQDFAQDSAGTLTFCGEPVTLMHMSGFKPNTPDLLAHHLRPPVTEDSPLGRFLQQYAEELVHNKQFPE